jgi:phosphate uptake regulator
MKRKVVQQGAATMMISLPSKWVKEKQLKKGQEVNIEEDSGKLVVSIEGLAEKKTKEISLKGMSESPIRLLLTNAYRSGYDILKVEFDEGQLKTINDVLERFMIGMEIIKKEKNSCIIESITEPSAEQFEAILGKIFMNLSALIEITENRINGEKTSEDYEKITHKIHQYDNFCRRVIIKEHQNKSYLYWSFLSILGHSARELLHLNEMLDKEKVKISPETKKIIQEIKSLSDMIAMAYQKKDSSLIEKVHRSEKEIEKKTESLLETKKGKEVIVMHYLASASRNMYLASSPLFTLLLEHVKSEKI